MPVMTGGLRSLGIAGLPVRRAIPDRNSKNVANSAVRAREHVKNVLHVWASHIAELFHVAEQFHVGHVSNVPTLPKQELREQRGDRLAVVSHLEGTPRLREEFL